MADSFVISSSWLTGIKNALGNVTSSGQAYAAIEAALTFASETAEAIRGGQGFLSSIFEPDPWRTTAAADVEQAAIQLRKEQGAYEEDSSTSVEQASWSSAAQKVLYVYSLAQVARKGYPADTDTTGIEDVLLGAIGSISQAVLDAPVAVIHYATNLANEALEGAGSVGKTAVKAAGGIVKEAATQVKGAAEELVPWSLVIGAVVIVAGAVFGLVYLSRTGTLKQVASLKAA